MHRKIEDGTVGQRDAVAPRHAVDRGRPPAAEDPADQRAEQRGAAAA